MILHVLVSWLMWYSRVDMLVVFKESDVYFGFGGAWSETDEEKSERGKGGRLRRPRFVIYFWFLRIMALN